MQADRNECATQRRSLAWIVANVLADLAYLPPDEETRCVAAALRGAACAATYDGPQRGRLCCWLTPALAQRIAANMLANEDARGMASAEWEDALREFVNVLLGRLVGEWFGTAAVFRLSIPTIQQDAAPPATAGRGALGCTLFIGGEPLVCVHEPD